MGRRDESPQRVWNRLKEQPGRIRTIDIEKSVVFAPGTAELGQFTLLVGLHTSGKTYLLNMLHEALPTTQGGSRLPPALPRHPSSLKGRYRLLMEHQGVPGELVMLASPDSDDPELETFPADELPSSAMLSTYTAHDDLAYAVSNLSEFQELTAGHLFEKKHLGTLSSITGRSYDWLEYSWYDEPRAPRVPYLRGDRDGVPFDTSTMSHAEHWVTHVLWHLEFAREGDLVLIDEPEAFLAGPGHRAFIDEIARRTLAKGCQTIVVTHADSMIRRVPPECVRLVTRGGDGARVDRIASTEAVLRSLSRDPVPVKGLVFVEDVLAARMTRRILERHAGHCAGELEIIASGGHSAVRQAVDVVSNSRRIAAVGVLDGDQRDQPDKAAILFLPGITPESELLNALTAGVTTAAQSLGVTEPELLIALQAAQFGPHQQVFDSIGRSLSRYHAEEIIDLAIRIWLDEPTVDGQARHLAHAITQALPA
ncbi:hypothetical protein ACFT2C_06350 [Promicromonospora sp. NPDC057138]|uniref:hypothetical protein n=1 Tax=Promicromonospora sp. NPDC057138 TaxID=3346031 RepID=UPI00362C0C2C